MKWIRALFIAGIAGVAGRADAVSGPGHTTIQRYAWGTVYHDHALGTYHLEPTIDGFRFTSDEGEVRIQSAHVTGLKFTCGEDVLTLDQDGPDLTLQGPCGRWTLRTLNGQTTLASTHPRDQVVFNRSANTFTISGTKGTVTVSTDFDRMRIESPQGRASVTTAMGSRTVTGTALDQIDYLGRGVFITFHGTGIFVDVARVFPMPEVAEWIEWKPIVPGT
jgi:hypothetical protein